MHFVHYHFSILLLLIPESVYFPTGDTIAIKLSTNQDCSDDEWRSSYSDEESTGWNVTDVPHVDERGENYLNLISACQNFLYLYKFLT